ncbi:hypothetical protein [uncultured Thiodictyon sp.]|jgi:hypothetical protein|uniref:hypothetical protein n=1 Tax=uncultured Thiodictyon sp. TaxID=1846217 RepID=UPI0025E037F4|nr:hypothetical protein [uncultured Thiodictyon sp.]
MRFHFKRYLRALRTHRKWAWLVFVPLGFYLLFAALDDMQFSVSQAFSGYSADIAITASNSPVATIKLGDVVADPELLFLDAFALMQLQKRLGLIGGDGTAVNDNEIRRLAYSALSLTATGGGTLELSYTGKDAARGRVLVAFYTDRILKRIVDATARTKPGVTAMAGGFQAAGDLVVVGTRAIWSAERLRPALGVLLLSAVGVLVLIGMFELSDPSFKSERQMARYLGVPVLGTMPDVGRLVRTPPQ